MKKITLTCLFGNGFDLALGLETGFVDFIKNSYLAKHKTETEKTKVCSRLANQIAYDILSNGESATWADAEMCFAKLDSRVLGEANRAAAFEAAYNDFSAELKVYLRAQDKRTAKHTDEEWEDAGRVMLENAFNRIDELFHLDMREVSDVTFNLITLNYTQTLKKMVKEGDTHRIQRTSGGRTIAATVGKVISAHGTLEKEIVFGIDNLADVADPEVREDCAKYFLKDNQAWAARSRARIDGLACIEESDYLLLFGLAGGKSDAEWWRRVYEESFGVGGKVKILLCSFDRDKETFEPTDENERDLCRKIFANADLSSLDESMNTYWQRMSAICGRDVLGIGSLLPNLRAQGERKSFDYKVYYKGYLREKANAGDDTARTLLSTYETLSQRPTLPAEEPSDKEYREALGEGPKHRQSRQKVYKWELSRLLKEKKNSFNSTMFDWLEANAEETDAVLLYALGWLRYNGEKNIAEMDKAKAAEWWQLAAKQGYAKAQFRFGACYYLGEGVKKNYADAAKWWRMAAEQGFAAAQSNLGICYNIGLGVKKDPAEAVKWLHKAAQQGHATAQYELGRCYYSGDGVEKDFDKAEEWLRKAIEGEDESMKDNADELLKKVLAEKKGK